MEVVNRSRLRPLIRCERRAGDRQKSRGVLSGYRVGRAVGIDILAEQGDFTDPRIDKHTNFIKNVSDAAGHFSAPGIGNDTIGAEIVAALHDGDITADLKLR